jgi:hypothetical protein
MSITFSFNKKRPHTLLSLGDDGSSKQSNNSKEGIEIQRESIEYYSAKLHAERKKEDLVIPCNTQSSWRDVVQNYQTTKQSHHGQVSKSHEEIMRSLLEPVDTSKFSDSTSTSISSNNYVPLDDFGAAMLRGMGWKGHGDAIGLTNKRYVEPVEVKPREGRLGLGATEATILLMNSQTHDEKLTKNDDDSDTYQENKKQKVDSTT